MDYITRSAETEFLAMSRTYKVVLVTGAEQIGKTTMMKHLSKEERRSFVSMEELHPRTLAETDPDMFFEIFSPPIIIDAIHYAPFLLKKIREMCEAGAPQGQFWLTCAPKASFLEYAKAFMGDKMGVLEMFGLSMRERTGMISNEPLDFSYAALRTRLEKAPKKNMTETFRHIWKGGMPQMKDITVEEKKKYFWKYNEDLLCEVQQNKKIRHLAEFNDFLAACAMNISKVLSVQRLGKAAGMSTPTAKKWLHLLIDMGIIYLLEPYDGEEFRRTIGKPKLYFTDTGLCSYISNWKTPEELMRGNESDAYFQNHMVMEVIKNLANRPDTEVRFFRDCSMREINLLVIKGNEICPIEIRKDTAPLATEIRAFSILNGKTVTRGRGGILCGCREIVPIDETDCYIPHHIL